MLPARGIHCPAHRLIIGEAHNAGSASAQNAVDHIEGCTYILALNPPVGNHAHPLPAEGHRLDPFSGEAVLELTEQVIQQENLTTLMVTHNMEQALRLGNRLIMMVAGHIILDLDAEQKSSLTLSDLVEQFEMASGKRFVDDTLLLQRQGKG